MYINDYNGGIMLIAHQLKKTLEVEHVTFTKGPEWA